MRILMLGVILLILQVISGFWIFFGIGYTLIVRELNSQDEMSEIWIGEWAEERGIRDQLFIATKVSSFRPAQ